MEGRLTAMTDTLTGDAYSYTCLGLFERHKLMLSFQMAIKILEAGPMALDPQVGGGWAHEKEIVVAHAVL